jgi:TrmH family RNA methyltransferase
MISSRQNQRLKDIRRLRRSKGDLALLEGPHLIAEALAAGIALDEVLATPPFLATPEGRRLAALLPAAPLEVAPELLDGLTDADSPQGVLAVARLPRGGVAALPVAPGRPYLYLDGLQDPGNLGALARVAEAAGAAGLALSPGCVHPNHPRALRASAGSLLRLPVAVAAGPEENTAATFARDSDSRPFARCTISEPVFSDSTTTKTVSINPDNRAVTLVWVTGGMSKIM